jgi:hypothetical protein
VTFKVRARYSMSVAESGRVSLVFQDRAGLVEGTTPQTHEDITESRGTVELTRVVTIPAQTDQLHLFIPLAPKGLDVTDGEIVIIYPVTPSGSRDHAE